MNTADRQDVRHRPESRHPDVLAARPLDADARARVGALVAEMVAQVRAHRWVEMHQE
ncbi:MAG: hypothetical protein FWF28_07255 [Micrococcales bacterium]|nr:hypothetical protein [Micrococcales bacterium]